jgi:hypothetical protein
VRWRKWELNNWGREYLHGAPATALHHQELADEKHADDIRNTDVRETLDSWASGFTSVKIAKRMRREA